MPAADLLRCVLPGRSERGRVRAVFHGAVIADSDETILLEGNRYFPRASVRDEHLEPSPHTSTCPWKGRASYFDVRVGDAVEPAGAWSYANPSPAARNILDHVAFVRGVEIETPR